MLSRIFGFVRDILFAGFLGAGAMAEAFWIAFSLPNMFRRIFAEGALTVGFTPIFCKYLHDKERAEDFASNMVSIVLLVLAIFSIIAIIFMPTLIYAVAAGFGDDPRFDLAVLFGRISFSYILFISIATIFSSILHSAGHFALATAMQLLLNLCFIMAIFIAYFQGYVMGTMLSIAALGAGFLHMIILWRSACKIGFKIKVKLPKLTPDVYRFMETALPAILAGGVMQINLLVGRQVASFFDGAIAWLFYADRLYQLPLAIVGISVGVVLLPELSRQFAQDKQNKKDKQKASIALSRSAEFSLALGIPAAVAFLCISEPLISVLFERGAFTRHDAQETARILEIYALGLPAFMLSKILQTVYFARQDTKRPFHYAAIAMVSNAIIAIGLSPIIGYISAAWATTLSAWVIVGLLAFNLNCCQYEKDAMRFDKRFWTRLWRIILASALMGGGIYMGFVIFEDIFYLARWRYGALLGLVLGGIISYALMGRALGAFSFVEIRHGLSKSNMNT